MFDLRDGQKRCIISLKNIFYTTRRSNTSHKTNYLSFFSLRNQTLNFHNWHLFCILQNSKNVAFPMISPISPQTLEFSKPNYDEIQIGGFDFSGSFIWERFSNPHQLDFNPQDLIPSPIAPSEAFVINKNYFWEIGAYDGGMTGWGSESLDLSFRIWMCGRGKILMAPCSIVGHITRDDYLMTNDSLARNAFRVSEVWFDPYQKYAQFHHPQIQSHAARHKKKCQ